MNKRRRRGKRKEKHPRKQNNEKKAWRQDAAQQHAGQINPHNFFSRVQARNVHDGSTRPFRKTDGSRPRPRCGRPRHGHRRWVRW